MWCFPLYERPQVILTVYSRTERNDVRIFVFRHFQERRKWIVYELFRRKSTKTLQGLDLAIRLTFQGRRQAIKGRLSVLDPFIFSQKGWTSALQNSSAEESLGLRGENLQTHAHTARRLAEDCDGIRVTPKGPYVVLDPLQCKLLIPHSVVAWQRVIAG